MEKRWIRSWDSHRRDESIFLVLLLLFGLGFLVRNAHLQLASDDIGWLREEAPTVFDQYRYVPRLFFVSLHGLFGPNTIVALVMIFSFHFANSLLVSHLCQKLLNSQVAARVAAIVFMVNPLTLSTLTWISCFSYVLGTSLALLSLLAAWKGSVVEKTRDRPLWWAMALACYAAGLFCSHELLFLPVIFILFAWPQGEPARSWGTASFVLAMACALLVNSYVYDFGRYGIETHRLFSPGFISALTSSALSSGLSLGVAYTLSFFVKPQDFLRICFSQPLRWGMTVTLLTGGVLSYRPTKTWRARLVLTLSFVALITPYIIRLYLGSDSMNYHISYVLSGRVFYLPFVVIALIWGETVARLYGVCAKEHTFSQAAWLLPVLSVAAYVHALFLYGRRDFMGLAVLQGSSQQLPPPWNPYAHDQPAWSIGSTLIIVAVVAIRFVIEKLKERRAKHEKPSP